METARSTGDLGIRGLRRRDVSSRRGAGFPHATSATVPGGTVIDSEPVGDWIRILRVGRPPGFEFEAGQYARISCGGSRSRKFSIASAPNDSQLEFCIGLNPEGEVTPCLFSLGPGSQVGVAADASGSFRLEERATHHVMVATATGVAPIRSMLRSALHARSSSRFTILHGASRLADLPYRAELEELAATHPTVSYVPTVSRPQEASNRGWAGATGRVEALLEAHLGELTGARTCVYACGNPGMIANVRSLAEARNLRVRTESFG